jgi:hypothetical protein
VQWFIAIVAGLGVALAWIAIWTFSLRLFGIAAFGRKAEDRVGRRERIKKMGKLRYILVFGMLGFGVAFGLGSTVADFLDHSSNHWVEACGKFVFFSLLFGWFHGARTWSEAFRDPVPFPPNYLPPK